MKVVPRTRGRCPQILIGSALANYWLGFGYRLDVRHPTPGKFSFAVQGQFHGRILAAVAHYVVFVLARLRVCPSRRKSGRAASYDVQPASGYACWRLMARSKLDLRCVGRSSRDSAGCQSRLAPAVFRAANIAHDAARRWMDVDVGGGPAGVDTLPFPGFHNRRKMAAFNRHEPWKMGSHTYLLATVADRWIDGVGNRYAERTEHFSNRG